MSITSCPRCSGQVTLPVGASNSARVRCPLCRAHYTLADALVNMPPLLEVVEDAAQAVTAEWRDTPPDESAEIEDVEGSLVDELEFEESPTASTVSGADLTAAGSSEELTFDAAEAEEDDLGQDTEIEDLSSSTFDSIPPEPRRAQPAQSASDDDENVLDFGEPLSAAPPAGDEPASNDDDEMALDFGADEVSEENAEAQTLAFGEPLPPDAELDDEIKFDLDQPETVADTNATIEFSDAPSIRADDEVEFDLDATDEAPPHRDPQLREFGDLHVDASGEAEDIPLDVPDAPVPAAVAAAEPAGKKKGKKKKEKRARPAGDKPKRSWVTAALVPVIALPIALYIGLWTGFDPIGLAQYLPGFMVPAGMRKVAQNRPSLPPTNTGTPGSDAWAPTADEPQPTEPQQTEPQQTEPQQTEPPVAPSGERTAARPTTPDAQPADDAAADERPTLNSEPPALDAAADAPLDPSAGAPAGTPAEMPAEAETPPADNPLTEPKSPPAAEPAPELPAESPSATPADDSNPFDSPKKDGAMPAEDDPLAPDKAARPADDDLFAPAKDKKSAAADPFAPADDARPAPLENPSEPSKPATEPLPVPDEPATPVEPLGPRNVQPVTPADLQAAMQAVGAAGKQMMAAQGSGDEAQLRKARASFYPSLFGMANALTLAQLGPAGAQLDPQMRALEPMFRQQLAADPKQLELLKVFGARWFAFAKRTNNGVVLAGTVESVNQVGKLFHFKVRPGSAADTPLVTIVSARDPQLAAGDEVLALGSIVESPLDQLAGYEGAEAAVVWSGMTLKISPPGN
jgi:hypothetical protein